MFEESSMSANSETSFSQLSILIPNITHPFSGFSETQFSIFRPRTRLKCAVLLVTSVAPATFAAAAIIMSNTPIGVPARSRSPQILAYSSAHERDHGSTGTISNNASKTA